MYTAPVYVHTYVQIRAALDLEIMTILILKIPLLFLQFTKIMQIIIIVLQLINIGFCLQCSLLIDTA